MLEICIEVTSFKEKYLGGWLFYHHANFQTRSTRERNEIGKQWTVKTLVHADFCVFPIMPMQSNLALILCKLKKASILLHPVTFSRFFFTLLRKLPMIFFSGNSAWVYVQTMITPLRSLQSQQPPPSSPFAYSASCELEIL